MTQFARMGNSPLFRNVSGGGFTRTLHASNYDTVEEWIRASVGRHATPAQIAMAKKQFANTRPVQRSSTPANQTSSGTPADVSGAFERALAELRGSTEAAQKLYAQGRNQATSSAAINAVNTGMANVFNAPAFGLAYDQANRPGFEVGLATQRANVLQNLGSTAANIYGTNVAADTSRYAADVGSSTALGQTGMNVASANQANQLQFQTNRANQALQKYIADLTARYNPTGLTA